MTPAPRLPRRPSAAACLVATAVGLAALASGSAARAERVGVIAVDGKDPPVGAAALADQIARAAPDATDAVLATAAANLRAGAVPRARLERFTQVRAGADAGWQAFLDVQPDTARARLQRARADAEDLLVLDGGRELYADISLRLGVVLDYVGRKDEAGAAIRLALALDPERVLSEREFSPDALAVVDAARAVAPPRRSITLRAATAVRGAVASLEVDGQLAGRAPLAVELADGPHVAIARSPGHLARALAFAVDAAGATEQTLDLELDAAAAAVDGGVAAGDSDARATAAVEAALRYGEVDAVLVAATAWRRDEPAVFLQRCLGVPVRCTAITEIGYGDAGGLVAAIRAGLGDVADAAATLVAPTLVGDGRLRRGPRGGGCCRPWVWAVGGGAAVVATVLAIVLTADKPTHFVLTFDPGQVVAPAASALAPR